jgi:DNA-binding transcriptional regulator YhcF (GntR family)
MPRTKYVSENGALELLATINPESNVSVYVQLENLIHFGIASGRLKAKDRLPPARELAEKLDINMNTVSKAYRDLVVMGLLSTRRGLGVFINEGIEEQCRTSCRKTIVRHMYESIAEAMTAGFKDDEIVEITRKVLDTDPTPYGKIPDTLNAHL